MLLEKVMSWDQKKRGDFVRETRDSLKLTRAGLAQRLGMHPTRLGRIERGVTDLLLTEFFELCLLVGMVRKRARGDAEDAPQAKPKPGRRKPKSLPQGGEESPA
jgi:transcriptional regulator with XRE-family HTH domain